jgi:hypothetical protein
MIFGHDLLVLFTLKQYISAEYIQVTVSQKQLIGSTPPLPLAYILLHFSKPYTQLIPQAIENTATNHTNPSV